MVTASSRHRSPRRASSTRWSVASAIWAWRSSAWDRRSMRYSILVAGDLDPATDPVLEDLQRRADGDRTELTGEVGDQSALVGLITRLNQLQLEVIRVTPIADSITGPTSDHR